MKYTPAILLLSLSLCAAARAAVISKPFAGAFANGGNIPDGNATGWSDPRTLSGLTPDTLSSVSVKLHLTGGYNGDLYAYVSHDGVLVPLLNRVGVTATAPASAFGYSDSGFDVTFQSSSAADIHLYQRNQPVFAANQLTGDWQPDGRAINPLSTPGTFDAATAHRISLDAFNGRSANGVWTLFIADLSPGGGQSRVQSWELDLVSVPEPGSWGLLSGFCMLGLLGCSQLRGKH
jgi:hypothetical protein